MKEKTSTTSSRLPVLRRRLRGLLLTAGVLSLLVWSLSSLAVTSSRSTASPPKSDSKSTLTQPKLKLEPVATMPAFFKASGDLDQVRNGTASSPIDPPDWVNGNAGASNAHYHEGESIPYRLNLTGLSVGPHIVIIEWDTRHSSVNAIDYITYYDRISETVLPLLGLSGSYGSPTSWDIPTPGITNGSTTTMNSFLALSAAERKFTTYNATNVVLSYAKEDALTGAQTSSQLRIDFNASASNVLFSWGGHIASAGDWGSGNSAAGISGSPYHTRFISLDGSGGNQDRSLSAAAVLPPQGCSLSNDNIDVCDLANTTVTHSLAGTAVAGQNYSFNLVNSGGSNASITSSDTDPSDGTISATVTTNGAGSYTITLTTTNAGGSVQCSATVRVHQPPAADAGNTSYEHCITDGLSFTMNDSSATIPSDGALTWSVTGGATISDIHALHPTITLPAAGSVTATLTVTGGTSCQPAQDTSTLTVSPVATANAGADQAVCASSPTVQLNGSIGGSALSASWSGGSGTFNPNANTLNASYTPSAAEITAGSVTLTLTTNDPDGSCGAANDSMTITINPNPTVEISLVDACAATAHLHATVTGGTAPFTYHWKKNNVDVGGNSADLTLSGPGTYTVSVTDSATPGCGSNTDSFVVCYTEGAAASAPVQVPPNSTNAAIKPKSETPTLVSRLVVFMLSKLGAIIL